MIMNGDDKLRRKDCRLVQPGKFREQIGEISRIESIVDIRRMNSREFEYNSLDSANRMIINIAFYDVFSFPEHVNQDGDVLKVYAPRMFIDHISKIVEELACGKLNEKLVEPCSLLQYLKGSSNGDNFWWDLDNDFYIFFSEENENLVLEAQKAMRQRLGDIVNGDWDYLSNYYSLFNPDLDSEAKAFLKPKRKDLVKRLVRVLESQIQKK